jgi:predicted amidohydrolase YtcJ
MPSILRPLAQLLAGLALTAAASGSAAESAAPADLIFYNAKVWTVDAQQPLAQGVAVRGDTIAKVGSNREVLALKSAATRTIDLKGKLLLPGFNDAHTHFENAADSLFQLRVIDLDGKKGKAELIERLRETVQRVPKGLWITGGDWGDLAATKAEKAGRKDFRSFNPDLAAVDAVAPDHPVLLRRHDHSYFANSKALQLARITKDTLDPRGGRYERDPVSGALTGMLYGSAGELMLKMVAPVTLEQKLIGARAAITELNRYGVTSITDIARCDAISQRQLPPVFTERSYTDLRIFQELKRRGQLGLRVYTLLPLETWSELAGESIQPGSGDALLRFGGLKAFGDSGLMFEPLHISMGLPSDWAFRFMGEDNIARKIIAADSAGYDIGVHIIGDRGAHLLLGWYAAAAQQNSPRDRRHRLIHAWYMAPDDLRRAGEMRLIADVTADHLLRNVDKMEQALGAERARSAFAWRSMIDHGVRVNIVSDLPGSYNKLHLATIDPLKNIYAAVTRKDPHHPAAAWHPEQGLTIAEAIAAYTLNPAYSSREEQIKGSISAGKLADLVVLSNDILDGAPEKLLSTEVVYTVLGGKIVFSKPPL